MFALIQLHNHFGRLGQIIGIQRQEEELKPDPICTVNCLCSNLLHTSSTWADFCLRIVQLHKMNAELSQLRSPGMRKGTSKRSQRYPTTCMRVLSESAYPGTIHVSYCTITYRLPTWKSHFLCFISLYIIVTYLLSRLQELVRGKLPKNIWDVSKLVRANYPKTTEVVQNRNYYVKM